MGIDRDLTEFAHRRRLTAKRRVFIGVGGGLLLLLVVAALWSTWWRHSGLRRDLMECTDGTRIRATVSYDGAFTQGDVVFDLCGTPGGVRFVDVSDAVVSFAGRLEHRPGRKLILAGQGRPLGYLLRDDYIRLWRERERGRGWLTCQLVAGVRKPDGFPMFPELRTEPYPEADVQLDAVSTFFGVWLAFAD